MREIRRFTAIGLAEAFLRAVARALADSASRSANFGKTKRRIMKTTPLLTFTALLLCVSPLPVGAVVTVGAKKETS